MPTSEKKNAYIKENKIFILFFFTLSGRLDFLLDVHHTLILNLVLSKILHIKFNKNNSKALTKYIIIFLLYKVICC